MGAGPGSTFSGEARVRGGPARGKGTPQGLGGRAALPARRLRCSWPGGRGPEPRTRGARPRLPLRGAAEAPLLQGSGPGHRG